MLNVNDELSIFCDIWDIMKIHNFHILSFHFMCACFEYNFHGFLKGSAHEIVIILRNFNELSKALIILVEEYKSRMLMIWHTSTEISKASKNNKTYTVIWMESSVFYSLWGQWIKCQYFCTALCEINFVGKNISPKSKEFYV